MSDEQIYAALAAVMDDCKSVAKRDRNEHARFLFRGIDAVVNAVGPILRKHAVVVVPTVQTVSYDTVQTSTGKPSTACRLVVDYTFYAGDGSRISTTVAAEAWDSGDKAAPKAMSVAFRTALLQSLALPTDEPDPDSHTYEKAAQNVAQAAAQAEPEGRRMSRPKPSTETAGVTPAQIAKLGASMGELGLTARKDALAYVADVIGRKVESRNELTKAEAHKVIDALERDLRQEPPEGDQ